MLKTLMTRGQFLKALVVLAASSQLRTTPRAVTVRGGELIGKTYTDEVIHLSGRVVIENCTFTRCKFVGRADWLAILNCQFEEMALTLNCPGIVVGCWISNAPPPYAIHLDPNERGMRLRQVSVTCESKGRIAYLHDYPSGRTLNG